MGLVILFSHNIQASTCDSISLKLMEQTWREFRAIHPFGFQTVALKHFAGDKYVFVLSEPAEWVRKADIDSLFSEYGGHVITARKKYGFDGGMCDIVGCALLDSINFVDFEKKLFTLLYGTGYRPYYTDLNNPARHVYFVENHFDTIRADKWLNENWNQYFYRHPDRWFSYLPPRRCIDYYQGFNDIFKQHQIISNEYQNLADSLNLTYSLPNSMYYSENRGVVIWAIPSSDGVFSDSLFYENARRFVLDCDLVLAACCHSSYIFLVGREREIPVNVLPPLRTETIRLLATLDEGDFSVSIASGLDDNDGYVEDSIWARSLVMSDKLKNTELGNVLMLADVLLMSWGNQAKVRELFIDYPQPSHPLSNLWFAYQNEEPDAYYWKLPIKVNRISDDFLYALFDNPGCLKPLYAVPNSHSNRIVFDDRVYNVFSSLNSTDLIRVAQYALIYKAFQVWKKKTGKSMTIAESNANEPWIQTPSMAILNVPWGTAGYLE